MSDNFLVVIPAYDGVDLLDIAAPRELFGWVNTVGDANRPLSVVIVTEKGGTFETRTDGSGNLKIISDAKFCDIKRADILWVPGGSPEALCKECANDAYMKFLNRIALTAPYITSVCEGAILLAHSGLLDGFNATTHWAFKSCIEKRYPKVQLVPGYPRFVVDDRKPEHVRVTGGGISSGLDEALELIRLIAGAQVAQQVQLSTQYFPHPPVYAQFPPAKLPECPIDGIC